MELGIWIDKAEKLEIEEINTYLNGFRQDINVVKMELTIRLTMNWQRGVSMRLS